MPPTAASPAAAGAGDIRVVGEAVEWRCPGCRAWNALQQTACAACGTARAGFDTAPPPRRADVPATTAVVASALWPGAGHLLLGHPAAGLARGLLWVLWAGGGIGVLRTTGPGAGALLLLLAAAALWVAAVVDVHRLAAGCSPVLAARQLAWAVVAVTLLLVGTALVGALGGLSP